MCDCKNRIAIYSDLEGLMKDIRTEVTPDDDDLIAEARSLSEDDIGELLDEHQFSLGRAEVIECRAFFTETPDKLYLQFTVVWQPLFDETLHNRCDGRLTVVAEGTFVPIGIFSDGHLNKVAIDYTDKGGSLVHRGTINARASAASLGGPLTEKHTLRVNVHEI